MYSGVLMTLRPLANCWVLAAKWNVNGNTCDCKLHRGATELAAPGVYLQHNISIWMFAGMHRCGGMPRLSVSSDLNPPSLGLTGSKMEQGDYRSEAHWLWTRAGQHSREEYLREVTDEVAAFAIVLSEDVEKEGLHIIVQGLVVQEQLGQQTQVLTVDCAHVPVDLLWKQREKASVQYSLCRAARQSEGGLE